ncbi:MAG TPA: DUF4405 domain-containing protein, partial [Nitrospiria bacterium]|nr:DUF4405 domain-containing protein [Nitrospiria bacterium]
MNDWIEKIKKNIVETQAWKSVFRHGYMDTDSNRALVMFSNVLLHLHPVKVRQAAIRIRYTWCLGGLTFFMFILLTITGVFLMFYYVPDTRSAYMNIKDLQYAVSFGRLMRNLHRWAAHAMVFLVWLH